MNLKDNYDLLINGSKTIYLVNFQPPKQVTGLIYFIAKGKSDEFFDKFGRFICRIEVKPLISGAFIDSEYSDFKIIEQ